MARIFVTGSADGLGLLTAKALIQQGHNVILHARNTQRAEQTKQKISGYEHLLAADLTDMQEIKLLAQQVNDIGRCDTVIHNAGVYRAESAELLMVNTLAPYVLTALITKPTRLIYLSSGMHRQGKFNVADVDLSSTGTSYSESKLHVLLLAKGVARKWPDVYANAVDPGWVPTKMGGAGAPDDLEKGYETQIWLATSQEKQAMVSGHYFHHLKIQQNNPTADNVELQDKFLEKCEEITGVRFPD